MQEVHFSTFTSMNGYYPINYCIIYLIKKNKYELYVVRLNNCLKSLFLL